MKKPFNLLVAILALVLWSGVDNDAVQAQTPKNNRALFAQIDADNNQKISMDEFTIHFFKVSFHYLDKNGDGQISKQEWLLIETQEGSRAMFQGLDSDQNGFVTIQEFSSPQTKRQIVKNLFRTLDKNGDSKLEQEELGWK